MHILNYGWTEYKKFCFMDVFDLSGYLDKITVFFLLFWKLIICTSIMDYFLTLFLNDNKNVIIF